MTSALRVFVARESLPVLGVGHQHAEKQRRGPGSITVSGSLSTNPSHLNVSCCSAPVPRCRPTRRVRARPSGARPGRPAAAPCSTDAEAASRGSSRLTPVGSFVGKYGVRLVSDADSILRCGRRVRRVPDARRRPPATAAVASEARSVATGTAWRRHVDGRRRVAAMQRRERHRQHQADAADQVAHDLPGDLVPCDHVVQAAPGDAEQQQAAARLRCRRRPACRRPKRCGRVRSACRP